MACPKRGKVELMELSAMTLPEQTPAAFYFDLGSPHCYLAAERILHVLPGPAEWRPALASQLGPAPYDAFRCAEERAAFVEDVERRAHALGLMALRWPDPFPADTEWAMLAATYAKQIGRGVAFSLAAFRQAFAAGRDLSERDNVLLAAAACEMHPAALVKGAELRGTREALAANTERARADGVRTLPAVWVDGRVLEGERAIPA
jgi:2-hydroxychromene-2-carboxylate isomerase